MRPTRAKRYFTLKSHKLKGTITLTPDADVVKSVNSAGDLMSFTLTVPGVRGRLVVQRGVYYSGDGRHSPDLFPAAAVAAGAGPFGAAGSGASGAGGPSAAVPDPLPVFLECLNNTIKLLNSQPDMEGRLCKMPMGRSSKGGSAQNRYFVLQGNILRYYAGGKASVAGLKGTIGLTKDCVLNRTDVGFQLTVPEMVRA